MSNRLVCQDNKRSLINSASVLFRLQFEVVEMEFKEGFNNRRSLPQKVLFEKFVTSPCYLLSKSPSFILCT